MSRNQDADVIVIGAGVIGCISARALARDHDVLVLERNSIAAGASGLAGASTFSSRFASDLPVIAGHINQWFSDYAESGRVDLTRSRDYEPVFREDTDEERDRVAEMARQGYPVAFVEEDKLTDRCPQLSVGEFGGAIRHGDYSWVDPIEYITALADDARSNGATFRTGVEVTGLETDGDRIVGVETDSGVLTAETVVAAAGWRTGDLVADAVSLPLEPYITQGCEIEVDIDIDVETFPAFRVPVRSETGTIYSGGHETLLVRPKHNGNLRVAGGHNAPGRDEYDYIAASGGTSAQESFVDFVRRRIPNLLVDVDELRVVDDWAGTGGGLTPDKRPIIAAPSSAEGLVIATGFRAGFIQSPIAAQGVRSLVTGEGCSFNLDIFALNRF